MANPFMPVKSPTPKIVNLPKSAGILDDYAVRKNVATKEGTIEKVPVNDSDIVNKKYVDDEIGKIYTTDFTFVGAGTGLPYGSTYGTGISWTQASAAQNTWYNISDTDMTTGDVNLMTGDGSGKLTVTKAGKYLINYSISLDCSENDTHLETGIEITNSGSANAAGICCFDTYERLQSVSGTAVISLAANATIELAVRTTDAVTPDISVQDINLTVVQVGG